MSAELAPGCVDELIDVVRSTPQMVATGGGTKPRLSQVSDRFARLSTLRLRGIVEYQPDEFTLTALAGTSIREIAGALAARGQYLPFDPLFVEAGATLGGTVAAGTNGPGRFRFGGVRDFILGVRFLDGGGRLLHAGGKVVKNAAGFDLPKFFVGSLGRYGLLVEITVKVFPRPQSTRTLKLRVADGQVAARVLTEAANSRWEVEALDLLPAGDSVLLRLAGPGEALTMLAEEVLTRWRGVALTTAEAEAVWQELCECRWAHPEGVLVKIPLVPAEVPAMVNLVSRFEDGRLHVSAGGNVAFLSLPSIGTMPELEAELRTLGLAALTLRGEGALWLGTRREHRVSSAVKAALDPQSRFPAIEG